MTTTTNDLHEIPYNPIPEDGEGLEDSRTLLQAALDQVGNWLGSDIENRYQLHELVKKGVEVERVEVFKESHQWLGAALISTIINPRTLRHRKEKSQPLTQDETQKFLRVMKVIALSEVVFGDGDKAKQWMRSPKNRWNGESPIDMIQTETGAELVSEALYQIDEGYF